MKWYKVVYFAVRNRIENLSNFIRMIDRLNDWMRAQLGIELEN